MLIKVDFFVDSKELVALDFLLDKKTREMLEDVKVIEEIKSDLHMQQVVLAFAGKRV